MTEEKINALRQTDVNLRDALKLDEAECPQMPADLNERLMQRMVSEKKSRRIVWPWIAAACVAGVMMLLLMPPKEATTDVVVENTTTEQPVKKENSVEQSINNKVETQVAEVVETETSSPVTVPTKEKKAKLQNDVTKRAPQLLALETPATQTPVAEVPATSTTEANVNMDLATAETVEPQGKPATLTERDIPITRPENYKYTPEEMALLKKQANEAYLKWVELELEIAKHNLEQTAQQ